MIARRGVVQTRDAGGAARLTGGRPARRILPADGLHGASRGGSMRAGAASPGNGLNAGRAGGAGRSLSACTPRMGAGRVGSGGSAGSGSSSSGGGGGGGGGGSGGSSSGGGNGDQPHPMRVWTLAFAALLVVGGVFAFVKK
ncbi:hypothetical protein FOA52_016016, partial [Chlamydomonas sp. UWO 241]